MLLLLPLAHNLLTAEPLTHGLLVTHPDLFIHLMVKGVGSRVRVSGGRCYGSNCHIRGNDKPPFLSLLTFQTDSDPAGKATPFYAARRRHRQSIRDGGAPPPCTSEGKTCIFNQSVFLECFFSSCVLITTSAFTNTRLNNVTTCRWRQCGILV